MNSPAVFVLYCTVVRKLVKSSFDLNDVIGHTVLFFIGSDPFLGRARRPQAAVRVLDVSDHA